MMLIAIGERRNCKGVVGFGYAEKDDGAQKNELMSTDRFLSGVCFAGKLVQPGEAADSGDG